MAYTEKNLTDQSGKTFLVTGANTGLGYETARALAQKGGKVWLACRSENKAQDAIARIKSLAPEADLGFVPLDLNDLNHVADAAEVIKGLGRLDVLINNAGLMVPPLGHTVQGFESQMGVNHLGHFALIGHLLPKLMADNTRIVVLSSLAHRGGVFNWDDFHANKSYNAMKRYQASKLANMMFGLELERRLRAQEAGGQQTDAKCVICHPGVAATELVRYLPGPARFAMPLVAPFMNSATAGAWPTLLAATENVDGGTYWGPEGGREMKGPAGPARISGRAHKQDDASRLWDLSIELTGVNPGI